MICCYGEKLLGPYLWYAAIVFIFAERIFCSPCSMVAGKLATAVRVRCMSDPAWSYPHSLFVQHSLERRALQSTMDFGRLAYNRGAEPVAA